MLSGAFEEERKGCCTDVSISRELGWKCRVETGHEKQESGGRRVSDFHVRVVDSRLCVEQRERMQSRSFYAYR